MRAASSEDAAALEAEGPKFGLGSIYPTLSGILASAISPLTLLPQLCITGTGGCMESVPGSMPVSQQERNKIVPYPP